MLAKSFHMNLLDCVYLDEMESEENGMRFMLLFGMIEEMFIILFLPYFPYNLSWKSIPPILPGIFHFHPASFFFPSSSQKISLAHSCSPLNHTFIVSPPILFLIFHSIPSLFDYFLVDTTLDFPWEEGMRYKHDI